jgi:hypothetical protein
MILPVFRDELLASLSFVDVGSDLGHFRNGIRKSCTIWMIGWGTFEKLVEKKRISGNEKSF